MLMVRRSFPLLIVFCCFFSVLSGQNRDLQFILNPVQDSANVGDTVLVSGFVLNHGPASFAIPRDKPIIHVQGVEAIQVGSVPQKPDLSLINETGNTIVLHAGDSLPVSIPVAMNPAQFNATGGGGGLDIVIIIWPSRAYEPIDPNHGNNTDSEVIYLKEASLNSLTTDLDDEVLTSWTLFPNPTTGLFTLTFDRPGPRVVCVYSFDGREMMIPRLVSEQSAALDLSHVSPGFYLVQVKQEDLQTSRIIVIQ